MPAKASPALQHKLDASPGRINWTRQGTNWTRARRAPRPTTAHTYADADAYVYIHMHMYYALSAPSAAADDGEHASFCFFCAKASTGRERAERRGRRLGTRLVEPELRLQVTVHLCVYACTYTCIYAHIYTYIYSHVYTEDCRAGLGFRV